MKKKEITVNGTMVTIEETKEKMSSVHIQTEDADVYINGVLVWQKYDNPAFAKIPPVYRAFVSSHSDYIKENNERGKSVVEVDCHDRNINGVATFYFPQNLRSAITVRFDFINSLEDFEENYLRNCEKIDNDTATSILAELKELWSDLEKEIKSYGWNFTYSHAMNEKCWGWWDVTFKHPLWNEEYFTSVWKKVADLLKRVEDVMDQYQM